MQGNLGKIAFTQLHEMNKKNATHCQVEIILYISLSAAFIKLTNLNIHVTFGGG